MSSSQDATHGHGLGHVVPMKILIGVLIGLLVLTWVTVAASYVDLGPLNIWVALFIAALKGSLVVLFFMHLRWSQPFNSVVLIVAFVLFALFVCIALLDTHEYKNVVIEGHQPDLER